MWGLEVTFAVGPTWPDNTSLHQSLKQNAKNKIEKGMRQVEILERTSASPTGPLTVGFRTARPPRSHQACALKLSPPPSPLYRAGCLGQAGCPWEPRSNGARPPRSPRLHQPRPRLLTPHPATPSWWAGRAGWGALRHSPKLPDAPREQHVLPAPSPSCQMTLSSLICRAHSSSKHGKALRFQRTAPPRAHGPKCLFHRGPSKGHGCGSAPVGTGRTLLGSVVSTPGRETGRSKKTNR